MPDKFVIPTHAVYPQICRECEQDLFDAIAKGQQVDFAYCKHNKTLAYWTYSGNAIDWWNIQGPVEKQEAIDTLIEARQRAAEQLSQRHNLTDTQH